MPLSLKPLTTIAIYSPRVALFDSIRYLRKVSAGFLILLVKGRWEQSLIPSIPHALSLFSDVRPHLSTLAADEGADGEARSAAIEALAACCFAAAEEPSTPREIMDGMRRLWRAGGEPGPRAAALRGWSLLFSSLRDSRLGSAEVQRVLEEAADIVVGDRSVDVRTAAGELAALLCDSYRLLQQSDEQEGDSSNDECSEEGPSLQVTLPLS